MIFFSVVNNKFVLKLYNFLYEIIEIKISNDDMTRKQQKCNSLNIFLIR